MRKISIIFLLFALMSVGYLHRVPGLLGDEASEGENVYQLLHADHLPIVGERSYIGVLTDYVRVPFIFLFGYSAFALRFPLFLISIATYILAHRLLRKHFSASVADIALVVLFFSPIYILYQRLGWAITLLPFFSMLLVYSLQSRWRYMWPLSGLIAGIGLQTHLLFFPSMVAIFVVMLFGYLLHHDWRKRIYSLKNLWQTVVGFWAGFGLQFAILRFMTEDQGDVSKTTQLFGDRMWDLFHGLPTYLSGSSFAAQYTGAEFSQLTIGIICTFLILCIAIALLFIRKRPTYMLALFACIHTPILLYMVDRYSLRYFVVLCLALWLLAGIGFGFLCTKVFGKYPRILAHVPTVFAVLLSLWMLFTVLIPFLKTGGSIESFSLGNRTTSANAFLDDRALIACLRGKGPVYSEREPIQNILMYNSHRYEDLVVVDEDHKQEAMYIVAYSLVDSSQASICSEVKNFIVKDS